MQCNENEMKNLIHINGGKRFHKLTNDFRYNMTDTVIPSATKSNSQPLNQQSNIVGRVMRRIRNTKKK